MSGVQKFATSGLQPSTHRELGFKLLAQYVLLVFFTCSADIIKEVNTHNTWYSFSDLTSRPKPVSY